MDLQVITYSSLIEEEDTHGWNKLTIQYINENRSKVMKVIKSIASSMMNKVQNQDADDIYSEVLLYLYKSGDYDLTKAMDNDTDNIVSLEGYVNTCIKYCVIRYCTSQYAESKDTVGEYVTIDGKELSLFSTITDEKSEIEEVVDDIEDVCKCYESMRYKFGVDLYLIIFIRLLTTKSKDCNYLDILNVLGVSKKDLKKVEKSALKDNGIVSFAKSINACGVDKAIGVIEKYIYSADKIKSAIV